MMDSYTYGAGTYIGLNGKCVFIVDLFLQNLYYQRSSWHPGHWRKRGRVFRTLNTGESFGQIITYYNYAHIATS